MSLKGNSYRLALNDMDHGSIILLGFDFTRETYVRLCLPASLNDPDDWKALSVVKEENLSVSCWRARSLKIEIWVTNKIDATDAALSWRKSFAVDLEIPDYVGDVILLVDEEKKVALYLNAMRGISSNFVYKMYVTGEDGKYYTETPYLESSDIPDCWPLIFDYVPSLVQIPQGRGKNKRLLISKRSCLFLAEVVSCSSSCFFCFVFVICFVFVLQTRSLTFELV